MLKLAREDCFEPNSLQVISKQRNIGVAAQNKNQTLELSSPTLISRPANFLQLPIYFNNSQVSQSIHYLYHTKISPFFGVINCLQATTMASFLASPTFSPATPRVSIPIAHQRSFSINGGLLYFGLKRIPAIRLSKAANISSTRSKCFRTTISCSAQVETLEIVQSTIAKQLSIDVSTVAPETKFADLGADSLDTVEIMMALEEQFGVSIGEEGAQNIATVQDAADLIEKVKATSA